MDESIGHLVDVARALGNVNSKKKITTTEFGMILGTSQQTASRILSDLEEKELIRRTPTGRGSILSLTPYGVSELRTLKKSLESVMGSKTSKAYGGELVSGLGQGAYYIKEYSAKLKEAIGYTPYPGTLNIRLDVGRLQFNNAVKKTIPEFRHKNRSFGMVELVPAELRLKNATVKSYVIIPERTHHRLDLELICRHNIRKKYKLADGEKVTLFF